MLYKELNCIDYTHRTHSGTETFCQCPTTQKTPSSPSHRSMSNSSPRQCRISRISPGKSPCPAWAEKPRKYYWRATSRTLVPSSDNLWCVFRALSSLLCVALFFAGMCMYTLRFFLCAVVWQVLDCDKARMSQWLNKVAKVHLREANMITTALDDKCRKILTV